MFVFLGFTLFISSFTTSFGIPNFMDHEDHLLSTIEVLSKNNYTSESHVIETLDGYLLTLHRVTGYQQSTADKKKPVVFLMHCVIASSSMWVMYGPKKSLAYKLVDAGYDVWLGNARGNIYSRAHKTLNADRSPEYWNFSWHEIGTVDLPAMIDFILEKTGNEKLQYIGYSMGTTVFYVMCSQRPEYNDKITVMQGWAPVVFMSGIDSPILQKFVAHIDQVETFFAYLGLFEFSLNKKVISDTARFVCFSKTDIYIPNLCVEALVQLFGVDPVETELDAVQMLFGDFLAGSSIKQLIHYGQVIRNKKFAQFDYGRIKNQEIYGKSDPPEYDLTKITVPVVSWFGLNDNLATPEDVKRLSGYLKNYHSKEVPWMTFNHLSFLIANNIEQVLHRDVMSIVRKFDPLVGDDNKTHF